MKIVPSTEERVWAVLSHLSALAFGMGLLLPVIGWSEQRRKSNYVSFQCLQALGYQSLGYTVWVLFSGIAAIIFVIIMLPTINAARELNTVEIWVSVYVLLIFGLFGGYFLLPIIATVSCALGKDFRYPFMGNRLERYLGYDPIKLLIEQAWLIEDHEDRWVAAMGHFSVIIATVGNACPAHGVDITRQTQSFPEVSICANVGLSVWDAVTVFWVWVCLSSRIYGFTDCYELE